MGSVTRILRQLSLIGVGICIGLLIAAVSASALRLGGLSDLFGPGLIRAEAVIFANGQDSIVHFDKGRIILVGPSTLVIRERDLTRATVSVDPAARITLNGVSVPLSALHRTMQVQVFRANDGPAYRVEATLR